MIKFIRCRGNGQRQKGTDLLQDNGSKRQAGKRQTLANVKSLAINMLSKNEIIPDKFEQVYNSSDKFLVSVLLNFKSSFKRKQPLHPNQPTNV